jgi:hypothetical protein
MEIQSHHYADIMVIISTSKNDSRMLVSGQRVNLFLYCNQVIKINNIGIKTDPYYLPVNILRRIPHHFCGTVKIHNLNNHGKATYKQKLRSFL